MTWFSCPPRNIYMDRCSGEFLISFLDKNFRYTSEKYWIDLLGFSFSCTGGLTLPYLRRNKAKDKKLTSIFLARPPPIAAIQALTAGQWTLSFVYRTAGFIHRGPTPKSFRFRSIWAARGCRRPWPLMRTVTVRAVRRRPWESIWISPSPLAWWWYVTAPVYHMR